MTAFGVLASGSGTNLEAILEAEAQGRLGAPVRLVLSDRAGAPALARAERRGVPARHLSPRAYADRASYDRAVAQLLVEAGCDWVVLAGYMRLVTAPFLEAFGGRVLNLHPSLLPAFPGLHAQRQALRAGVKVTGCTVHLVDEGTDTGPILLQAAVPVLSDDTEETLAARIRVEEHRLLPLAMRAAAEGRIERSPGHEGRPLAWLRLPVEHSALSPTTAGAGHDA